MGTERIQNGYENANGTGIERIQNGYRTDIERISNRYGTVMEHKSYKSVLQENAFFRTHATLQYKSRYQSSMIISAYQGFENDTILNTRSSHSCPAQRSLETNRTNYLMSVFIPFYTH